MFVGSVRLGVWGVILVVCVCVCVGVGGGVRCRCVCVCVCDLLIFLTEVNKTRTGATRLSCESSVLVGGVRSLGEVASSSGGQQAREQKRSAGRQLGGGDDDFDY